MKSEYFFIAIALIAFSLAIYLKRLSRFRTMGKDNLKLYYGSLALISIIATVSFFVILIFEILKNPLLNTTKNILLYILIILIVLMLIKIYFILKLTPKKDQK